MSTKSATRPKTDLEFIPIPPPDRQPPGMGKKAAETESKDGATGERTAAQTRWLKLWTTFWIALAIAAIVFVPHLFWLMAPELPLNVLVVDKTVPFEDLREHRGLFWLLGQNKFIDKAKAKDDQDYKYEEDYVGYFPLDPPPKHKTTLLHSGDLADRDVLYIADTYGVYSDDYEQFPDQDFAATRHSTRIFGGMEEQEVEAVEGFAKRGKLIIAEFNTFGSPTQRELRRRMERVLGVTWTRWIGRYFIDFQDEKDVPAWLYELYELKYGKEWDLTGSGYMLCRDESTEFIILKDEEDVLPPGLELVPRPEFAKGDDMQGVERSTHNYWFDIIVAHPGTTTLAEFEFHLTPSGEEKLKEHHLTKSFPAVTRLNRGYTAYYLAGDFVDFDKAMGSPRSRLTLYINRSYYGRYVQGSQGLFYWHTYYPLMCNILRKESNKLNNGLPSNVYLFD
ncbi:hypothetical protein IIA79_00400 [bacterium]|nr:hypothetical protein [bacterium]